VLTIKCAGLIFLGKRCEKDVRTTLSTISKAVLGLILSIVAATAAAEEYYTIKDGQLERPTGYREWVYVGTPVTPNDLGLEATIKSKKHFPDGATIVKELRAPNAGTYTTGTNVSYATDGLKQWFAMNGCGCP
jgi:hypothetical protein